MICYEVHSLLKAVQKFSFPGLSFSCLSLLCSFCDMGPSFHLHFGELGSCSCPLSCVISSSFFISNNGNLCRPCCKEDGFIFLTVDYMRFCSSSVTFACHVRCCTGKYL